ncbi:MAG: hypothetical protein HQK50_08620 [Oligoflexia bacterium]|nr:hypothetical protein [Oligoflexia bacterium]MBF0365622.1 hypothetical protein [Oligoflexia bacterium]
MFTFIFKISFMVFLNLSISFVSAANAEEIDLKPLSTGEQCLDSAISILLTNAPAQSDPQVLNDILKNDMYLDDMKMDHLPKEKDHFDKLLSTPTDLAPMYKEIILGIQNKQPAIKEFLCKPEVQNILGKMRSDYKNSQNVINRMVNHIFLLNEITLSMSANPKYMEALVTHIKNTRPKFNISLNKFKAAFDIYRVTGELFMPAKALAMDVVMDNILVSRSGECPTNEIMPTNTSGQVVNIMEAVLADESSALYDNARAGIALAINPIPSVHVTDRDDKYPLYLKYHAPEGWNSLYETWNLAFLMGNVSNLNITYPKLLIPAVIAAGNEDYLMNRVESLWPTINFHVFAQAKGQNVFLPEQTELAKHWGEVNARYASAFTQRHNNIEFNTLSDLCSIPYNKCKNAFWSTLKLINFAGVAQ